MEKKSRIRVITAIAAAAILLGILIYVFRPYLSAFIDPERAKKMIIGAGAWGPVVFILMQVLQVLIAPLPGQITGLIGGYLFGPFLGVLYTMIGATIGFTIIFVLTRRFGRPFAERFVNKKYLDKFDYLTKEKGVLVFFLIFLLPAFPDDLISFIAGLTTIKISTLVFISVLGRLPGYVVLSLSGHGLTYDNLKPVFVTVILFAIIFLVAWRNRNWLYDLIRRSDRVLYIKQILRKSWLSIAVLLAGILIVTILLYRLSFEVSVW